jgi:two-component system sensor kinase FixL
VDTTIPVVLLDDSQWSPFLFDLVEKLAEFGVMEVLAGPPRECRWSAGLRRLVGVDQLAPGVDFPQFVTQYAPEEDRERALHELMGDAEALSTGPTTYRIRRADGALRRIRSHLCREQDERGRTVREIIIAQDVTAMPEADEIQRLLPDRLMQVSRLSAIGEMAAGMAHEINQPLTAIATYAQALRRLIRSGRAEVAEVQEAADQIVTEALRAGEIVNRIRELSQHVRTHLVPTDINAVVRVFGALVQSIIPLHQAIIRVELGTFPGHVRADTIQLQQLLLNLVRNAIDAVEATQPQQRDIWLTTRRVNHAVEISVEDTAGGIRPEILPNLYQPFVSSKPAGTGLGLLTCRRIVHAHGGKMGMENRPGRGARFFFTLPLLPSSLPRGLPVASCSL